MTHPRARRTLSAGVAALAALPPSTRAGRVTVEPGTAVLRGNCLDEDVPLSVEERRLHARLPDPADPSRPSSTAFAQVMIEGGGMADVAPRVVHRLCSTRTVRGAVLVAEHEGRRLWRTAVDRVQSAGPVEGWLPRSDDRPLYWTRLQVTAALRRWRRPLTAADRERLVETFEKASRGMTDITFPVGDDERVLVSGFDPYGLDGGELGPAPGTVGNGLRHGNPSGAAALALDSTTRVGADGRRHVVRAYVLPVNYTEFAAGWLEDTVGPHMRPGPRALTASVTISQGREGIFDLEVWNGRYHGVAPGNDASWPARPMGDAPQIPRDNPGCETTVAPRWGGPRAFDLDDPPQWTTSSLPFARMAAAVTGFTPPPGATWADGTGFPVVRNTTYTEFRDPDSSERVVRNAASEGEIVPPQPGTPPSPGSLAYAGCGGTYLSNESAYRNTLLRDRLGRDIPAGHIHTPMMQRFEDDNPHGPSDACFDAWRRSVVEQTVALVRAVTDRGVGG